MLKYLLLLMIGASDVIIPIVSFEVYCMERPKTNTWIFTFLVIVAIGLRCFTHMNYLFLNSAIFLLLALLTFKKKIDMRILMAWLAFSLFLFLSISLLNQQFYFNSMSTYLSGTDLNTDDFLFERNEFMCKMIYMLFIFLILSERQYKHSFDKKYWFKMRLFLILGMIIIFILGLFATRARDERQIVLYAFMAGLLFYLVYLLYLFFKDLVDTISSKQKIESQNKINQMKLQQLLEREENHEQMKRYRHDMKNNLNVLTYLLKEDKIDHAKNYLEKYLDIYTKVDQKIPTQNDILAAIILDKRYNYPQIPMQITYRAPKEIGIRDVDFCTIMGNLLDNAYEYLSSYENHGTIDLFIQQYYEKLYMEVSNDYYENDVQLESKKDDKDFHGFGLQNMQQVIEQYDGLLTIHVENKRFIVRILIELGGEAYDYP